VQEGLVAPDPSPLSGTITADAASLPAEVAAALATPTPGRELRVEAAGIPFAAIEWGERDAPPILLAHGVTSSSRVWWRVGPALAASGRHVVAPDLPGHGRTGHWQGRPGFGETAAEIAAFVTAAGLEPGALAVIGHSWGAMCAARLPAVGLEPERILLLDPPALPLTAMALMTTDPVERHYDNASEAVAAIRAANPAWTDRDVEAKADGLCLMQEGAVRAVLLENGDWDGGLAALAHPAAASVPTWLIRADPGSGGFFPDAALPPFLAMLGAARVITIAGAPHSPQRTHPEATLLAILGALTAER
jgi:pimeloyl-ACP methyl ester carboxylesterase